MVEGGHLGYPNKYCWEQGKYLGVERGHPLSLKFQEGGDEGGRARFSINIPNTFNIVLFQTLVNFKIIPAFSQLMLRKLTMISGQPKTLQQIFCCSVLGWPLLTKTPENPVYMIKNLIVCHLP